MIAPIVFSILNSKSDLHSAPSRLALKAKLQMVKETSAQKAKRMRWWKEDRFGLFIHWGLYSIPAGEWNGPGGIPGTDYAEWIRNDAQIPIRTYEKFATQFDPVQFNANQWVMMAKNAGMKYIVITTKHHDGFNMFASKYSKFNIMNTPWHHDPMKDLAAACKKDGMTLGFYHSIMDWHRHDYLPRRPWELANRPVGNANFKKYVQYLHNEITQLLTHYGPIGVLWFDGDWESTWNDKLGTQLYDLCRKLQPGIIVNNRVGSSGNIGDYFTPEQRIPDTGYPKGQYWETCMTMNDQWGYNKYDHDYKPVTKIIHHLVNIVSKGGNYLLNVGPTDKGVFPPQAVQLLHQIGTWMHVNGSSIYDTDASVFTGLPWGRSTTRIHKHYTQLYLDVEKWPTDGTLVVPGIGNQPIKAHILGTTKSLDIKRDGPNIDISVPEQVPNEVCSVIELDVKGHPIIYTPPTILATTNQFIGSTDVHIVVPHGLTVRYTTDGTAPNNQSSIYSKPVVIRGTNNVTLSAAGFVGSKMVTSVVTSKFKVAVPWPALVSNLGARHGLIREEFGGDFTSVAEFPATPTGTSKIPLTNKTVQTIALPKSWGDTPKEEVGIEFLGAIKVPTDGVYEFRLTSDDGSSLSIDHKIVVNNDGPHTSTAIEGSAPLQSGFHVLHLRYFNATGAAALKLEWKLGNGNWKVVPSSALYYFLED